MGQQPRSPAAQCQRAHSLAAAVLLGGRRAAAARSAAECTRHDVATAADAGGRAGRHLAGVPYWRYY
eukprot:scaffold209700_cov14-Tisochrysis_lutea.AAC.1